MDRRVVGRWIRTASERGLLSCCFDGDGSYSFAIAQDGALATKERGTFRTATRPSDVATSADVIALVLRTETGDESPLVVRFRGEDMLLDGQHWQRIGDRVQLPIQRESNATSARASCSLCAGSGSLPCACRPGRRVMVSCWSPQLLWIAQPRVCHACGGEKRRRCAGCDGHGSINLSHE